MAAFDPLLIIYQIVCLQCFYYLAMGTMLGLCHALFDIKVSLDYFFDSRVVTFSTIYGWIDIGCILMSSLAGAYLLSIVVEKSKKCVDFTFTLFLFHIILASTIYQFPFEWEWWVIQIIAAAIMASIGEYACAKSELEDIPLYSNN